MSFTKETAIRTICGFCHTNCGLIACVKDGRITRIKADPKHPVNMGEACPKGLAGKQIVYSPDRLQYPMRKTKSGFERISWDEAFDIISTRLLEIKNKYGGETIMRGGGAPVTEENRDGFSQLVTLLGSANYVGIGHICHQPRGIAFNSLFGHMPQPDYKNTRCIIIWGANPLASRRYGEVGTGFAGAYGKFSKLIPLTKRSGIKLIVIDPWHNKFAENADKWLRIEPGRDIALALAMLNVIIKEELYDKEFVRNWTVGFDHLSDHVAKYTPQWAESNTGIKAKDIEEVARLYATTKPATIRDGNAIDQYPVSVQTARAIGMLIAITGNLDIKGGNIFMPYPKLSSIVTTYKAARLTADTYPLFPHVPFPAFADAVLSGKPYAPRALIINHSNTLLVNANSAKTRQVLEKLEFLVVCDIFKTATAELADIILPETSPFERYGFRGYASLEGGFVALRRKVVEPVGEARPIFEIEFELAKRMGLCEQYTWTNSQEWINYRLKASNVTFDDLENKHIVYTTPHMEYQKYLKKGFDTPSKKVEFYSQKFKDYGYSPVPEYIDIDARFNNEPALKEQYPLIGTTRRSGYYTHTQFRNIPDLRKHEPEALIRINPADSKARGIKSGNMVQVKSPAGNIRIKSLVTDEIAPGIVLIDFGWGNPWDNGANVNMLTSDDDRDPIACSTSNHRFRCQVSKI